MRRLIDDGNHRCETEMIMDIILDDYGCCEIQVDPDLLYPPRFNIVITPNQKKICSIYLDRPDYCTGSPVLSKNQKDELIAVLTKDYWYSAFRHWIRKSDLGPCEMDSTYTNIKIPDQMPDYSKLPNKPNGEIRLYTYPLFNIDGYENNIIVYIVFTEDKNIYLDVGFKDKYVYRWMTVSINDAVYIGNHDNISAEDKINLNTFLDKYWDKIKNIIIAELTYPCQWYDSTIHCFAIDDIHPDYTLLPD